MARRGPKSKYVTHVIPFLDVIPSWRKKGYTEKQIAQKLGVAYSTLSIYKNSYSELSVALKIGKDFLISDLENSLYRTALGFAYTESKTVIEKDGHDKIQKTKTEITEKTALPNVGAICFALKNLATYEWRDKPLETIIEDITQKLMENWKVNTTGNVEKELFNDVEKYDDDETDE